LSFFKELKRRNVFRVGIAYVLIGWLLLQAADFAFDLVGAPNWVIQSLSIVVVIGLPVALFFAWAFELTPEGIKREHEVDRSQSITPHTGKKLNGAIVVLMALAIAYLLFDKFSISGPEKENCKNKRTGYLSDRRASDRIRSLPSVHSRAALPCPEQWSRRRILCRWPD
jgi:hypothetical protein